eukprot:gnl/TRDRNA2_/TRDRNA2_192079_c0_seq1.p1 gnl/TRDRNA2_/TRDRNA2_192079_c0~~gnl/TRDRNA2_/TRDRNA2_192079_c0_seq1.p1  ORF type:complete len:355 (+),score=54.05 gnl/TRDRNA2_/TRDRNA2_192079_c0_seq1:145-1209(+)
MKSLESLNAHFATKSYIGSAACATETDYQLCRSIKSIDIDAAELPHLHRWHSHMSYLIKKYGMFDVYGNAGNSAVVAREERTSKESHRQVQPKHAAPQQKPSQDAQCGSRYVAILDFEKSLKEIVEDRGQVDKDYPCEIIEFPTVLVDLETGKIIDDIQNIVKPKLEPLITVATTALTSITQAEIDRDGVSFCEAFEKWHSKMLTWQIYSPLLATCGDMDIQRSLPKQLEHELVAAQAGHKECIDVRQCFHKLQEVGGHRWCNIKEYFKIALGENWETRLPWFDEAKGIREHLSQASMLEALNLDTEGHHHRGIDDCRSLAKLMVWLYRESHEILPQPTGELKEKSVKALKKGA